MTKSSNVAFLRLYPILKGNMAVFYPDLTDLPDQHHQDVEMLKCKIERWEGGVAFLS